MAIQYDELNQGLIKTKVSIAKPAENFTWCMQNVFGDPAIGTDQDYIDLDAEVGEIVMPEEAVKGDDPRRVNHGVGFDSRRIATHYFFDEDKVDLSSAKNRVFGEPVDAPWSVATRELHIAGKKRDAMDQGLTLKMEALAFELLLTGRYTTRGNGEQVFPVKNELLALSGSTLITKPFETINAACNTLFENGVMVKRLVLNPIDAVNLTASSAWQTLCDKKKVMLGSINPSAASNGYAKIGTMVGLLCGDVEIATYAGYYGSSKTKFLPQGKALLLPEGNIGRPGYTGLLVKKGDVQDKVAAEKLFLVYGKDRGMLVDTMIQMQSAGSPLLTSIDSYGVMTGIPTV